jgi:hypothetical protein
MTPSWRDRGPLLVTLATVGALALYFALDGRLPRDPGLYWADVPRTARALGGGRWDMVAPLLQRPGGWLVVTMAALSRLSRGPWLFEGLSLVSVAAVVASAGRLGALAGRAAGGDQERWGGWLGALLAAGMPLVVIQGRLPWIHLPEAALLGVLWVQLTTDPKLARWHTWLVAGLAGAALASVRHSGLVWLLTAVPLLRGRAFGLLIPWTVGALPSVLALVPYLTAKLDARESYAARLPSLLGQVLSQVGVAGLGVVLWGLVARGRQRLWDRWALLGGGLVGTALLMWLVFRAGLDNFTPMVFGLVLLAAAGAGRLTVGLAAAGFLGLWGYTFVPGPRADFRTLYRVSPAHEVQAIEEFIDATCVRGRCVIGADSGLFLPHGEEPGRLELWILGRPDVFVLDLRTGAHPLVENRVSAVAEWDCGEAGESWMERFPQSRAWQEIGRRQLGLKPTRVYRPDNQCALVWWVPGGYFTGPEPSLGRPPKRRARRERARQQQQATDTGK